MWTGVSWVLREFNAPSIIIKTNDGRTFAFNYQFVAPMQTKDIFVQTEATEKEELEA